MLLIVVLLLVVGVYSVIIPLEEAYLAGHFGASYQRYIETVPRIVPLGGRRRPEERAGTWRADVIARAEIITLTFFILMLIVVYLKLGPWADWGVYF